MFRVGSHVISKVGDRARVNNSILKGKLLELEEDSQAERSSRAKFLAPAWNV
jgi:hypothetical protein